MRARTLRVIRSPTEKLVPSDPILDIALDYLSMGRALRMQTLEQGTGDFDSARGHLNQAVTGLRQAGGQDDLPRGLLARAELFRTTGEFGKAQRDLGEVLSIAQRSGMRLHLADYHLESARLHLAMRREADEGNHREKARVHLDAAGSLIKETGYRRRDGEAAELEAALEGT